MGSNCLLMHKIFFFILPLSLIFSDVDDHFKKIVDKTEGHSIRNIDFIYMINLDQRPEKFAMSQNQLAPYGIHPFRFSAVNGWELSLEAINDIGVTFTPDMDGDFTGTSYHLDEGGKPSHETIENFGQTYFIHTFSRGGAGCALSHLSVLQDAYDSGYETIWIMEDDVEVLSDPTAIPDLIDLLDSQVGASEWDILFTDRDFRTAQGAYAPGYGATRRLGLSHHHSWKDFSFKVDVSPQFRKIANRYGTHSMIIRRSGMKKLLQFFKAHKIFAPYDMDLIYVPGINLFTVSKDIIGNLSNAISDLGVPHYLDEK
jgi:GR25 family glycosyltransferase involved in LPS biosynthesis